MEGASVVASNAGTAATLRGLPLACPRDRALLLTDASDGSLRCPDCGTRYPVVDGVPVLINDAASVFAVADYARTETAYTGAAYGREADATSGLRRRLRRIARSLGDVTSSIQHPSAEDAIAHAALACAPRQARTLVIGAGGAKVGRPGDFVLQTDVAFAPGVDAIADAHDLPFPDGTFDLVVAVAVLEHVADPARCVDEFWRVLAPGGHAYAVTPFLQPVHMGAYDFTRFTPIGHRRLFRRFDEVAAGKAQGVGSAMGWVLSHFLQSVSAWKPWRVVARTIGLFANWPLRRLDRWLPHDTEAQGALWFLGRRREGAPVSDRELVQTYRQKPNPPHPWRSPLAKDGSPAA